MLPPRDSISGTTARVSATSEYVLTSSAMRKLSRDVSTNGLLSASAGDYLPDPHCTPGATNPRVTQADLASTICKSGYTASIRPPASITGREKKASEAAYGFTGKASTTEYDHLISLELGGDPNSPLNLWPEPNKARAAGVNNPKDRVEGKLKALVCNAVHGKAYLPLAKAQYLIATNWTTAIATAQTELVG